jgi:hypothetical protein
MGLSDGCGSLVRGGDRGALIRPERIRGSLQTQQAAELRQREPLVGQIREARAGLRSREVKARREQATEDLRSRDDESRHRQAMGAWCWSG